MDEQAKVHHHKSKHRRSGSSRKSDAVDDNTARRPKSPDDDSNVANRTSNVATSSQKRIDEARENDDPKIVLSEIDVTETVPKEAAEEKGAIQKSILGYMDREIKTLKKPQSLSDPTASPAQRSTRSRSSIEKSPRQKRSKSESRRRRERKLIAAGEMEVRQANETLMRYLKQCSEINDASLSGELEIDKSIDDRRVHRKTKSQRERRGNHAVGVAGSATMSSKSLGTHLMDGNGTNGHGEALAYMRDRIPPSGLSGILQELAADVVQNHGEIYNPFTPVVSPTDGPPMRTDKMYIQTPRGFRPVSDSLFYKSSMHDDPESHRYVCLPIHLSIFFSLFGFFHLSLDNIRRSSVAASGVSISCIVQRAWILISNICHGLLAGLALAHILFVITTKPVDWVDGSIKHYASFAQVYTNTFYFLAIICMVSIFDR